MTPVRLSYGTAQLVLGGGAVGLGPNFQNDLTARNIRLDRYQRAVPIVDKNGNPTMQEQAANQRNLEAIEAAFAAQGQQIEFLTTIVEGLQAAQQAAAQANQGVAALNAGVSLSSSRTEPVDLSLIHI